jgi:hypothetical protein
MIDKRQEIIDALTEKIAAGKVLTDAEVHNALYISRDHTLLNIAREIVSGKVPDKSRMRCFNVLQNAVDRYETVHSHKSDNPLEEMSSLWKKAIEKASDASGIEA